MALINNVKDIKIFEDIIRMLIGEIEANTSARKRFLEVAAGRRAPQTKWEFIYTEWEAAGRPDIETWFSSGKANASLVMNRIDSYREKKKPSQRSRSKPLSAAQAKGFSPKRVLVTLRNNINRWSIIILYDEVVVQLTCK